MCGMVRQCSYICGKGAVVIGGVMSVPVGLWYGLVNHAIQFTDCVMLLDSYSLR